MNPGNGIAENWPEMQ